MKTINDFCIVMLFLLVAALSVALLLAQGSARALEKRIEKLESIRQGQ